MKKYLVFLMFVGGIVAVSSTAEAGCSTGNPDCSGTKTFIGTADHRCFRVYLDNKKEQLNFCLHQDEPNPVKVQSGDKYCAWERNDTLPKDCKKLWIDTD